LLQDEIVPLVRDEDLAPPFDDYVSSRKKRGRMVANNIYALANAPELGMAARGIFDAATSVGSMPPELVYLIRYVVSNLNACRYCMTHQTNTLRHKFKLTEQRLREATSCETSDLFTEGEKAALTYAMALTRDAGNVPEPVYAALITHFNEQERVEITVIAAAMNMINIVNDGLRLPLEDEALAALERT
jgi:alkylhydroperoxidase family enzyme